MSEDILSSSEQDTNVYKFQVEMVVGIFAENDFQAIEKLDLEGGFVVSRNVKLLDKTAIHKKEDE